MKEYPILSFKQAEIIAHKYRDHLIGRDFLTGYQMNIGYEDIRNQPFIVEVVPAPADDKISLECIKHFLQSSETKWQKILEESKWNVDEYIVLVIATNQNRNEYANELHQFLLDRPELTIE